MSDGDYLGSEDTTHKIKYFLVILGAYLIMFFLYLGLPLGERGVVTFYIWFGLLLGVLPFLVDFLINRNKDLPLDTISYENNSPIPFLNNGYVQFGLSLALAVFVFMKIKITQTAFVQAPQFHINLMGVLSNANPALNAFMSGITGGLFESLVFFGFILPTIYAILKRLGQNTIVSSVVTVLLTSAIFTGYHFWHYQYLMSAMITVFLFGIFQCLLVMSFRSTIPAFLTHFANNFAVVLFTVTSYSLMVVL
ncbi:MAG: hypothetical protein DRP42_05245 [Tenericutes bacterium]|nr:MAG: hypothetical protein DRP42_05245 [Mycoplasmatota bacterium]